MSHAIQSIARIAIVIEVRRGKSSARKTTRRSVSSSSRLVAVGYAPHIAPLFIALQRIYINRVLFFMWERDGALVILNGDAVDAVE